MTLKETHIHFVEWEYNHNASDADWENRKVQSAGDWNVFRLTGTLASTGSITWDNPQPPNVEL